MQDEVIPSPADEDDRDPGGAAEIEITRIARTSNVLEDLQEAPQPGDQLGPYRLIEELGRGGMGIVFLAQQEEPVRRRVALKLLKSPFRDHAAEVRFDAERQAMARIRHPHVAQIHQAGTTASGRPFLAMELVEGEPITAYCDHSRLSVEDRIRLFRDVCAGVHHMHQKGILHRDLKPSNVLVADLDDRAVVKVIDLGIAKSTNRPLVEDTLDTGDQLLGTPAYLPPEALQGSSLDLDIRADVYSLGVLLFELLVGARPFDEPGDNLIAVLRKVAEDEPRGPSTKWRELDEDTRESVAHTRRLETGALPRSLRGELDWIVLKAIARSREERYASVAGFAADLDRFLQNEPVSACPPSPVYRFRKFVQRRSGVVAAGILVLLSLTAGVVARTIEARRAQASAQEAIEARQRAEIALEAEAEARHEAAELSDFLIDLFEVSDPGEAKGATITARELLDEGAQRMEERFVGQPLVRARFLQTVADVFRKLGLFHRSEELFRKALAAREEHLPENHPDVAETLNGLGALLAQTGSPKDAEPLLRRALAIRESQDPPNDIRLAGSLNNLANLYADSGRYADAEPLYLRAIAIADRHPDDLPADSLVAMNNLASTYFDSGRYEEAEPLLRRFLERLRAEHGEQHPHVAVAMENLAEVLGFQGEVEDAERTYLAAIAILETVLAPDHPEVAYGWSKLAELYAATGREDEAEDLFRRALAIQESVYPEDHPERRATVEGLSALEAAQAGGRPG